MTEYLVKKYTKSDYASWNLFIGNSKNGTFLFDRNFMEYHNDRFIDHSLLVFQKKSIIAVLPANEKDGTLFSHQGLTYGGLLLQKSVGIFKIETIFKSILKYLKENNFKIFKLKSLPCFYHKVPSFELEPILHKLKSELYNREQNFAIDYNLPLTIHKTKLKNYKKNYSLNFKITKTSNFSEFWKTILEPRLALKHNTKPVHSLQEIELLQSRFPKNICQYNISLNNEILAGITIFKTESVVKSQYGAVSNRGETLRALDFLFIHLIKKFKTQNYSYFDMGTVAGNMGLLKQKEELGCNQYLQDYYRLKIS